MDLAKGSPHNDASQAPQAAALEAFLVSLYRVMKSLGDSSILGRNGLDIDEWIVLSVLERGKELHFKDVVRQSGVPRQNIRKILQQLETKKLVSLTQSQRGDRHQSLVAMTSAGVWVRQEILKDLEKLVFAPGAVPGDTEKLVQRFAATSRLSSRVARALTPQRVRVVGG